MTLKSDVSHKTAFYTFASKKITFLMKTVNFSFYSLMAVLMMSITLKAQDANIVQIDSVSGKEMLVGEITRDGLKSMGTWFEDEYNAYIPDSSAIKILKENRSILPDIFVVLGTWCGDSREHVPHFYKIIDLSGYPEEKIFAVGVDRLKKGGDFCLADFNINLVPTFILSRKGGELGRIVETPEISLEQDMVNFITHQNN